MSKSLVQPNGWVALRLPSGNLRVLQIAPNTTISLGKYGSFPSNLLIERPFHITYEVQEKRPGESFSRLRPVSGRELNEDILAETNVNENPSADGEAAVVAEDGEELALVDETGKVIARSNREIIDDSARQTLTTEEIEELKKKGASAGKELIAKLMLSHTAIDQKTSYSLAKYKLLKEKKFLRRFTVLPLDVVLLGQWLLEDKDAARVLEMRPEMMGLLGCWADVHFGGSPIEGVSEPHGGRWLVVDDTGGLLIAAMAERMGILYPPSESEEYEEDAGVQEAPTEQQPAETNGTGTNGTGTNGTGTNGTGTTNGTEEVPQQQEPQQTDEQQQQHIQTNAPRKLKKRPRKDDLDEHYALTNTLTIIHANAQPNLSVLRFFDYDAGDPNPPYPYHPLFTHLLPISWLQLVSPGDDLAYTEKPAEVPPQVLASWKPNRRGNYHRKRRRWARTHEIVDATRAGGFSGLAVASTMDPISLLRHALPLLAGGSPIAIYSPTIELLEQLVDCFSIARRAAWVSSPPPETVGKTQAELDRWAGTKEFPINPTLVLGASVQSSRARRWQVLPGRTHPFMTGRGGADGFLFTGWRSIPAEGRISARGKFQKKR
ncbi:hypothetical protein E4U13_004196 [Claviceps humidiphila]|uniref:tRNA (adenine(58)-N(1))-methyltransferase non-catalytic subunit TRM6 n=1 Tax=Claviceps humidiphila TaxID=1294629 RepID=A0A9P7TTG6_9HYPO|nr:hypothetical protein E4U13_004196 [Claviceps humidiphila]